jgi:chitodextrinase
MRHHPRFTMFFNLIAAVLIMTMPGIQKLADNSPLAAPVCNSSSPASAAYTATICLTSPASGATLTGLATVSATISVTGTNPGVRNVVFYFNNAYLLTDYQSPYSFTLPTQRFADGSFPLKVQAVMRDNFTTQFTSLTVTLANGNATAPVNTNSFTPSPGQPAAPGAPLIVAATGDGASGETNAGNVSNMINAWNPNLFLYLGDVYGKGTGAEFYNWYGQPGTYFGRFRGFTNPVVGNHEYENGAAPGYFDYWDNIPNYYSYNAGGWHFIALNSNSAYVGVAPGTPQYQWLEADLKANPAACTIAYFHHPVYNIGPEGPKTSMADIWSLLANYGVEIVLTGHDHDYQRWTPLDGAGQPNSLGITEFVVGGGGHGYQTILNSDSRVVTYATTSPNAMGALRLVLNTNGASFGYYNLLGTLVDSGTIGCHGLGPDTQPPSVPPSVAAQADSSTQASLGWGVSTDNVAVQGYEILRDGATIASVTGSIHNYTDSTLTPATTYQYAVLAFDAAGNRSAPSAPIPVTTPPMPASLTFNPVADTYVSASSPASNYGSATSLRQDASPDLHSYLRFNVAGLAGTPITKASLLVYTNNSTSLGITAQSLADNTWGELTTNYNNAPVLGSALASSGAITTGTWVTLNVTPYVTGQGTFSFGITTPSTSSISLASRESGANAPRLVLDLQISGADTQPPSIPAGLTAAAVGPTQVNLGWAASTDNVGVSGYTIFRNGTALTTVPGSGLSYSDTTVVTATTYSYTVDAFDQAGNHSAASGPVVVSTPDNQPPSIPPSVTGQAVSPTQATINWGASTDNLAVQGYDILRDGVTIASVASSVHSYTDGTLSPATTYQFAVAAFDAAGNRSAPSASVPVTTPSAPASVTFNPVADTYVSASSPATNYGASTSLRLDASPDLHSYLRFNITGLGGRTVVQARLLIYTNTSNSAGIVASGVTDTIWDERAVNYSNAPVIGSAITSSGAVTAASWVTLNVTGYITTEGLYSFAITTPSSSALNLSSRESGAFAPQLVVDLQ